MIIALRSRYSVDQIFAIAQWSIVSTALILFLIFSVSLTRRVKIAPLSSSLNTTTNLDLNKMVSGPLKLYQSNRCPLALALEQKLVLLAQSTRPSTEKIRKAFRIGVKGTDKQRVIKEGEAIFFDLIQHSNGAIESLEFSTSPADIRMVPHVLDENSLILKLQQGTNAAMEVFLKSSPQIVTPKGDEGVFSLCKAKWWGKDLFFREYGGEKYCSLGQKHKIEIGEGTNRYLLFIQSKDFLSFYDGRWHVVSSLEEAGRDFPLANIISISQNDLEIKAWDIEGFSLFHAHLGLEKKEPLRMSPDQLITAAKLRSARQVSCKIGKKQMFLKPGDWLIKTQTNWHKLIEINEIESYLNHELLGELFIVDAIDSSGKLRGHYFNQMRTEMQPFAIQAASSKEKQTQKRTSRSKR